MKKVISLVLCTIMIVSLFAINTSAAVPMQTKSAPVTIGNNDGDNKPFVANPTAVLPATSTAKTITVDGNQVYEVAFNGEGAYNTSDNAYILCQYRDLLSSWWSGNFDLFFDIKPINNTSGIIVSIDEISNILHVYPASIPTGTWSTLKVKVLNKQASVYIKEQGDPDSEYKKLIADVDYKIKTDGAISSSTSYFGIDSRYSDMTKVDVDNYYTAKYYFDNLLVVRDDTYKAYSANFVYNDDIEIVFDTELGANGFEYKFPAALEMTSSSVTLVFDAMRTGGDRPIHVAFSNRPTTGRVWALNLFTDKIEKNVKYTVKADYEYASLKNVYVKAEGSSEWITLEKGVDYSSNGVYGSNAYIKFGYLGHWCYNADGTENGTRVTDYCGGKPALDDVNTVWTISNLQASAGYIPSYTAKVKKSETGSVVTFGAVAQSADFAVMIAVYDGETFAGAGVANFNHEGVAEINVDHSVAEPTFKAFIWNTANESAPMATPIDITTWVE